MKKIKAIWELMRLEHGVMIAIAILIGSLIALKGEGLPPFDKFILTFFTALFLEASTFALNDYYDLDIDKKNKRYDRPLVRGDISPKTALYLFYFFFPLPNNDIIISFISSGVCFLAYRSFGIKSSGLKGALPFLRLTLAKVEATIPVLKNACFSPNGSNLSYAIHSAI